MHKKLLDTYSNLCTTLQARPRTREPDWTLHEMDLDGANEINADQKVIRDINDELFRERWNTCSKCLSPMCMCLCWIATSDLIGVSLCVVLYRYSSIIKNRVQGQFTVPWPPVHGTMNWPWTSSWYKIFEKLNLYCKKIKLIHIILIILYTYLWICMYINMDTDIYIIAVALDCAQQLYSSYKSVWRFAWKLVFSHSDFLWCVRGNKL